MAKKIKFQFKFFSQCKVLEKKNQIHLHWMKQDASRTEKAFTCSQNHIKCHINGRSFEVNHFFVCLAKKLKNKNFKDLFMCVCLLF